MFYVSNPYKTAPEKFRSSLQEKTYAVLEFLPYVKQDPAIIEV